MRRDWFFQNDNDLLKQCEVDTYRASGPGGQKRNKTSSAVRLRHVPSGLMVIAEESRSQHENKAKALKRLRRALMLEIREPLQIEIDWILENGRIAIGAKNTRFWPAAAIALDALQESGSQVSTAAERLGVTTANLVDFLSADPRLWQAANRLRAIFQQKPLRS